MTAGRGVEAEVQQRLLEESNVLGAVRILLNDRTMSWGGETFYLQVIVPTVTYGAETLGLRKAERRRLNVVFEMKWVKNMVAVTKWNRIRNDEIRRRAWIEKTLE